MADGEDGGEIRIATVRFSPGGRGYDYLAGDLDIRIGDHVVVNGNGGEKEVEVIDLYSSAPSGMALDLARYKPVLRKV